MNKIKWLIAFFVAISVVTVVRATLVTERYLPIVLHEPELTPTQTQTPTPTETPTPTITPTQTYTPTGTITITVTPTINRTPTPTERKTGVYIVRVEYRPDYIQLDEYVEIKNNSGTDVDMTGWRLRDDGYRNKEGKWVYNDYFFPKFTLKKYSTVKVWTRSGSNTSTNLYWNRTTQVWNDGGDCAYIHKYNKDTNDWERIDAICFP